MPISDEQLKQILEAALMAAGEPLTIDKMMTLFVEEKEPPTRDAVKAAIKLIEQESEARGIELKKVSSGYRFQAKKDFSPWVSRLWEEKPARYSRALLETLVLIAYKQPITRGEVEQVRGVAVSTNIIKTLLERDWVKVVGHREVPGRPALYATTKSFLDYFNLKSLEELPTLAEIRDLETIKPELELDLQQPAQDATAESSEETISETEAADDSGGTEEDAEMNESEVSEEEIDVNIEDTDNIRGITDVESSDEEESETIAASDSEMEVDVTEVENFDEESGVNIEDTDNIRGAADIEAIDEQGSETIAVSDYERENDVANSEDSEEGIEVNLDENNNIESEVESTIDDDVVTDNSVEEDYLENEESREVVTVSEDVDDDYSESDKVDSKFGG